MHFSLRALSVAAMLTVDSLGSAVAQENTELGGAAMVADKNIV